MARGRFLSESIAKDARLNSLSVEAELVYLMTIPHLDRDGLIEGDPDVLWGTVCPKRRMFLDRMAGFIQEWTIAGLVLAYDTDDGVVLWFKGFTKNQLGLRYDRETPSKFSPPPDLSSVDSLRQESGKVPEASGSSVAQYKVKDQVQVEVEVKESLPATQDARQPTPQQELFGAVCEAIGWDYKVLSEKDKGQVAQACGILAREKYTVDDIRRFMVDVWFHDWRWEKHGQRPTLGQLRQEIGKLRAGIPVDISPPKGGDYRSTNNGVNAVMDYVREKGMFNNERNHKGHEAGTSLERQART